MAKIIGLTPDKIKKREKRKKALERVGKMTITTIDNGLIQPHYPADRTSSSSDKQDKRIRSVVIDCSSIIFIDTAGARLFVQMCAECQKADMWVYLAECNKDVLKILTCSGLLNHLHPEQIFVTIHDAVVNVERMKEAASQKSTTIWV
ncbi:solute carrier family 26 member 10-like [Hemiscyllium ocellatum]|nr:solute carrier family 26 member 10-like [Hemiscyllium ocellatum]